MSYHHSNKTSGGPTYGHTLDNQDTHRRDPRKQAATVATALKAKGAVPKFFDEFLA